MLCICQITSARKVYACNGHVEDECKLCSLIHFQKIVNLKVASKVIITAYQSCYLSISSTISEKSFDGYSSLCPKFEIVLVHTSLSFFSAFSIFLFIYLFARPIISKCNQVTVQFCPPPFIPHLHNLGLIIISLSFPKPITTIATIPTTIPPLNSFIYFIHVYKQISIK